MIQSRLVCRSFSDWGEKNRRANAIAAKARAVDMIAPSKSISLLFDCPRTVGQNTASCLRSAERKLIQSVSMVNVFRR